MKRYRDNIQLIICNIIIEYVLLFVTYLVCGFIRVTVPRSIGKHFYPSTVIMFIPLVLIMALYMIVVFLVMGDYYSIHFRSKKRIVVEVFAVAVTAIILGSAILFFINGLPFSRILMIMTVLAWTAVISIKRILFEKIANGYFADKIATCNIILVGTGENSLTYYSNLMKSTSSRNTYLGYISNQKDDRLPSYLGAYDEIYSIISNNSPDKVVITEENLSKKLLDSVLSVCSVFGIEAEIVPAYADYIVEGQKVRREYKLNVLNVNAVNTSNILGVKISVTDMEKTIADIRENLEKWRGKYVCVSNVHTTVMAYDDPDYRRVQNEAVMALPDGGPLSSYSRSEGKKDAKRVTGPDLMREMLKRSSENGWRHFFYGSSQKTLDLLKEKIEKDYPGAIVAGMISPPYREITPEEDAAFVEEINNSKPDFVWVGLGAPKQEIWMAAHKNRVNALMIGVGAAFDYESGNLKRAPLWMQKCNLEWFYRFMQEPRRLFKRYLITNLKFIWLTRR